MRKDFAPLLHQLVFVNDINGLHQHITSLNSSLQGNNADHLETLYRGHTALTLAVSLNHKECVKILLDAGCSTLHKSSDGWSAYQEATSIGDREIMRLIFKRRRTELAEWFESKGKDILESLSQVCHYTCVLFC
jgi:ankyrin repeat protein